MIERIVCVCVCAHLRVIMRTPVREGDVKMRACAYREAGVSARARERERERERALFRESDESAERVHKKENEREIESKRHIRRTQT